MRLFTLYQRATHRRQVHERAHAVLTRVAAIQARTPAEALETYISGNLGNSGTYRTYARGRNPEIGDEIEELDTRRRWVLDSSGLEELREP